MNIIEKINEYMDYVNKNFKKVESQISMVGSPMFNNEENDFFRLIKIITVCAHNEKAEELRKYYFNKFMNKVKIALDSDQSVIFENGIFSFSEDKISTNLSSLSMKSDESDWEKFIQNVEYGFFALVLYCYQIIDEEDKEFIKKNKPFINESGNDFIHSIWTYTRGYIQDDTEEKKLLKVMEINWDKRLLKVWGKILFDLNAGFTKEDINNKLKLEAYRDGDGIDDDVMDLIDSLSFEEEAPFINDLIDSVEILNHNEYCSKEMKDIYLSFIKKDINEKKSCEKYESIYMLFNISKEAYLHYINNEYKGSYNLSQRYQTNVEDKLENKKELINIMESIKKIRTNYKNLSEYEKRKLIINYLEDDILDSIFSFIPMGNKECQLYLEATASLIFLSKEEKKETVSAIDWLRKGSISQYYLNLLNYLKNLPMEEKILKLDEYKESLQYLGLHSIFLEKEMLLKYFFRDYFEEKKKSIDDLTIYEKKLYTRSFTIESLLLPKLSKKVEKINSKYINIEVDGGKTHILFTSIFENVPISEILKEIMEIIEKTTKSNEINDLMETSFRNHELKNLLENTGVVVQKDIKKKKV